MRAVADLAERYSFAELRVTHSQNLLLADVYEGDLPSLWRALVELNLARPNVNTVSDIICLPRAGLLRPGQHRHHRRDTGVGQASGGHRSAGAGRRREDQDLRLHERLRPPPCRPHRHSGGGEEGRRVVPAAARRLRRGRRLPRQSAGAGGAQGGPVAGGWKPCCAATSTSAATIRSPFWRASGAAAPNLSSKPSTAEATECCSI